MGRLGGRPVRLIAALIFFVCAIAGIVSVAATALDTQGNDRLAALISSTPTEQAWRRTSQAMIASKKPFDDRAVGQLRALAVHEPLSAIPYYLIGASQKLKGDSKGGAALVALSVRRDPRFVPARYWQINDALDRRDPASATAAALRVAALDPARVPETARLLAGLTRFRESWPNLRAALANQPNWAELYFNELVRAKFEPSIVFSAIDVARATSGQAPSTREQTALLSSMIGQGQYELAYTAWLGWLPPDALGKVDYIYDGRFSGAPGPAPFNWTFVTGGDGSALLEGEHGLRFDYAANANLRLASQIVQLPAGRYKFSTFATLDARMSQDAPVPLAWTVSCLPKHEPLTRLPLPDADSVKGVAVIFDVPAGCAAEEISLDGTVMEFPIRVGGYVRSIAIDKAK